MDKVLILGTGNAQYDAIKYLKDQGMKVFCCSHTDNEPAKALCDAFELIDIVNREAVLEYAKNIEANYVYSVGSDVAMPSAMYVSEQLGLPHFISEKTATICNTKNLLREFLGQDFKGNLPYFVLSRNDEIPQNIQYPVMVKPVDSQGQRGITLVHNDQELKEGIVAGLKHSREGKVIVERFIDGQEVSVNAFVVNGKIIYSRISNRESFKEYPGGIIKEHHLPATWANKEAEESIADLVQRTAIKLEIDNGPIYFQLMIDQDNNVYLLEVTPRLDGCHMWHALLYYDDVNLLEATFDLLQGKEVKFETNTSSEPVRLKFMSQRTGSIFDPELHPQPKHLLYSRRYLSKGDKVKKLTGYMEKCGYFICKDEK